jgi:hypothetical protein
MGESLKAVTDRDNGRLIVKFCYDSQKPALLVLLFFHEARASPSSPAMSSSYLDKLEADRQAQHSGYGVRRFHCADGTIKWEAYGWECITKLTRHYTSYALFNHKWEAEQFFNNAF